MQAFDKSAGPQPSKPGITYTIVSDYGGTIALGNGSLNMPLIHFLLDAAENGHTVYIATHGRVDPLEDSLEMACIKTKRKLPDNIKCVHKFDISKLDVDIAFDNEDFLYLKDGGASISNVKVDIWGNPSVPYEKLRRMTGTQDSPYAAITGTGLESPSPKNT
ncbi:MAG TPA: hypothetical protein PKI93_07470 [Alphaproteobacteria bacterium]|nr:hypothetical protein [Alphaproteobacteria bacterium]HNS44494.1 hypothetical protein [Alphaproteobacteria bacterium]